MFCWHKWELLKFERGQTIAFKQCLKCGLLKATYKSLTAWEEWCNH